MVETKEELIKFSKWFRGQLLNAGMTARDLSILSGVDESEVSKMTRGVRWPSLGTIRLVAPHLKCTGHEFLTAAGLDQWEPAGKADPAVSERLYSRSEVEAILKKACQAALERMA